MNSSEKSHYIELDYQYQLNENVRLDLHAGRSLGDYWGKVGIEEYNDYSIGISTKIAGFDLSATYIANDIASGNVIDDGPFRNDNSLIIEAKRLF